MQKVRTQQRGLTTEIAKTREMQKLLTADFKNGSVSEKEYGIEAQRLSELLRAQTKEQAAATKQLDSLNTVTSEAEGSINQLRAELALTTASWNSLSEVERENSEAGKALQARTRALSDELKVLEGKVGDTRRNVGNYADALKGVGGELVSAAKDSDLFGGAMSKLEAAQQTYTKAQELATLAMGQGAAASSTLRVAMLAIPIFLVIAGLAVLFNFLSKTQSGADFLAKKMGALKGIFAVVNLAVTGFGEILFKAVTNPKQGLIDLVDFIETNLLNRLKSIGVIIDGIKTGNVTKIADGFVQAGTGVANASAKIRAFGAELDAAAAAGERLAAVERQLQRDTDDNIDTNKKLLNQVERLKNIRDNEFNSLAVRKQANEEAFKLDMQREATLVDLARRRVQLLAAQIAQEGGRDKVSRERYQELKEAENELADIQEDAAGKQNEFITTRFSLQKEVEEKLRKLRQDFLNLEIAQIDARLQKVVVGSEQELQLQKAKLGKQRALELSEADLTASRKKAIEEKYRADIEQLNRDHLQKLREQAAESQQIAIATQLARAREGSQEEFLLKAQAIQAELAANLAGIDRRQSAEQQAAQEARFRAEAAKQQADLEYQQSLTNLENNLTQQRTLTNQQYAAGQITKAQHEAALEAIERAGTAARIVVQQDYSRETVAEQETQSTQSIQTLEKELARKEAIAQQENQVRLAVAATAGEAADLVIQAFGQETAAGQAALALKKAAALAEISINLAVELSAIAKNASANPLNIPTAGIAGISQAAILSGIAVAKAAFATAKVLAFADGGMVRGPGGPKDDLVPAMLSDGEAVMTAEAVRKFGPLLSFLNVAGGGKSFGYRDPMPRSTLARLADGGVVRYDASYMAQMSGRFGGGQIDYEQLAQAIADKVVPGFYAANKALPAPNLNITELREKQNKVATNERRADR
ncbi:hypothetical protein E5K02_09820 [Hymenobacter metallicola]|uniref:Uncharacterized protein n=2 Tax=Hymenobacter metallicola TaxID=2563114 RepID=A0A4Z0QKF8_9BACT|nr:hypothetical protein E5K02_09820 [Hymenobacter metallicola]